MAHAGVVVRDTGAGTAVFATHRLWSSWLPGHRLFSEFHADLWQRRARVELVGEPFVAPSILIAESDNGSVFLFCACFTVAVVTVLWVVGLLQGNHSMMDGWYGFAYAVPAVFAYVISNAESTTAVVGCCSSCPT